MHPTAPRYSLLKGFHLILPLFLFGVFPGQAQQTAIHTPGVG
jgi:hypothetical protein